MYKRIYTYMFICICIYVGERIIVYYAIYSNKLKKK